MKKAIKILLLLLCFGNLINAQTIGIAEYFFDTDPGVGNGNQITMTSTGDSANATVTISSSVLSTGFHKLYVRVKNSSGVWSLHDEELIYVYSTTATTLTPPSQPQITKAEYFFDTDPGIGNGTPITGITSGDSIDITKTISISGLSTGYHRLYVRVRNSGGTWSLHDEELFYIYPTTATTTQPQAAQVSKVEYFIGTTDPGPGNGTAINATVAGDSITINDSLNVTSLSAGTYKITFRAKDADGKWGFSTTKEFTVLACTLPAVNFTASDVCIGDSVSFTNTSTNLNSPTYSWDILNDGSIDKTVSGGFKHYFATAGTYQVKLKITNQSLCSDSVVKTIIVRELPVANAAAVGNTTFCDGLSVMLSGNAGQSYSYQWFKDNTEISGATNIYYTATQGGSYKFKLTDGYGCNNYSNSIAVTVNPNPTATITPATTTSFCQGDSLQFNANAGTGLSYQWKLNGVNIQNATSQSVWVDQAGILSLHVTTADGCSNTSSNTSVTMNFPPFASIFALGATTFCDGDSVGLGTTTGSGYIYQWFKNSTLIPSANSSVLYADESGLYNSKITNPDGCSASSGNISVLVNAVPTASFGMDQQICRTDTANIVFNGISQGSAIFNWNFDGGNVISGSNSGPFEIIYPSGGDKIISLQLVENGCYSNIFSDTMNVIDFNAVLNSISTPEICLGDSMVFYVNSSTSYNYQWKRNGIDIPNANSYDLTSKLPGNYTVLVEDTTTGCSAISNQITLVVNETDFDLDFTASQTSFTNPPFTVQFTNTTPNYTNYFFDWSFGDGTSSTFFNPNHSFMYNGNYDIRLVAENQSTGCKDSIVKLNYISASGGQNNPCTITASIVSSGSSLICSGDSSRLEANSGVGFTYQWIRNNTAIPGADSSVFYAKATGSYRVIVSNSICSVYSEAFILSHYPGITPVIIAQGSLVPCTTDSMKLSLLTNYNSYNWSTGATTPTIWVSQTGYYTVTVTNNYGCNLVSAPFSVSSSFLQPPTVCLVGVDTANHNQIVWEKPNTQLIDSFVVYREGFQAGNYVRIGALPYSAAGIFSDTNSNPQVQAYRYKLAAVDTCGQLTLLSDFHKSIHLTINAGINGMWNLIWDGYTGFSFGSYRIYRGSSGSNLSLLTQIQSTLNSYSDINPPTGNVYYQIEVMNPHGCFPDSVFAKANTNYNTSRSNVANNNMAQPPLMQAEFSSTNTWGVMPVQVQFTDESSGYPTSWTWDFGDGQSSNQQNPTHSYTTEGIYDVSLTITNSFGSVNITKNDYIYVITNGVGDGLAISAFEVFPNPNDGRFSVLVGSEEAGKYNLEVINSLGQMVHSETIDINQVQFRHELDLGRVSKGVYHVILRNDHNKLVRKLVVE